MRLVAKMAELVPLIAWVRLPVNVRRRYTGTYCQTLDLCLGVECAATQVCELGVCNCLSGYENAFDGDTCSQEKRTKYLGNYLADDQCVGEYAVSIVPNVSDLDKFDLINFRNLAEYAYLRY